MNGSASLAIDPALVPAAARPTVKPPDDTPRAKPATPRPPLRVLMVVESSAGGTGRHVLDLADGMTARGCEVHVA